MNVPDEFGRRHIRMLQACRSTLVVTSKIGLTHTRVPLSGFQSSIPLQAALCGASFSVFAISIGCDVVEV